MEVMDTCVGALEKSPTNMEVSEGHSATAAARAASRRIPRADFCVCSWPQLACKQAKSDLDKKFGGPWHAVAGEGFGFTVTYEQTFCCCESALSLGSFPPLGA